MTARHPLFEFMPYGAPELIAAQRPNLLRALAFASTLAFVVFLVARAVGVSLPPPSVIELPPIHHPGPMIQPPPSIKEPHVATTSIAPPASTTTLAVPDPVPDAVAQPTKPGEPDAGARTNGVAGGDATATTPPGPTGPPAEEPLPVRGVYVNFDEYPVAVKQPEPVYPGIARDLGIDGRVYAFMLVGKDGHVIRAEVDEKTCNPMLKDAVITAAMKWVFTPAYANGHPVPVWVAQTFVFKLH